VSPTETQHGSMNHWTIDTLWPRGRSESGAHLLISGSGGVFSELRPPILSLSIHRANRRRCGPKTGRLRHSQWSYSGNESPAGLRSLGRCPGRPCRKPDTAIRLQWLSKISWASRRDTFQPSRKVGCGWHPLPDAGTFEVDRVPLESSLPRRIANIASNAISVNVRKRRNSSTAAPPLHARRKSWCGPVPRHPRNPSGRAVVIREELLRSSGGFRRKCPVMILPFSPIRQPRHYPAMAYPSSARFRRFLAAVVPVQAARPACRARAANSYLMTGRPRRHVRHQLED